MSPKQLHKLNYIGRFIALWTLFGTIYALVEYGVLGDSPVYPSTQNSYNSSEQFIYVILGATIMGLIVGIMELYIFEGLFSKRSFSYKILLKASFYSLLIALFLIILGGYFNSRIMGVPITDPVVLQSIKRFVTNFAFLSIFIYISFAFVINFFIFEMSKSLGMMVVFNFITGKYHKPIVEERIFMFMDMKSSTTIAEKLGHVKYYQLLNRYYSDMSDAILNTYGEIYQYVGDEIIVSWPLKKGLENDNCIRCFYEIKNSINNNGEFYINEFGIVPTFKAGMHCGKVTTGEIGQLKKEIVFTGDVLNTTSRIQERCNQYEAELLISKKLFELIPPSDKFKSTEIGELELRGKQEKVTINKLIHSDPVS